MSMDVQSYTHTLDFHMLDPFTATRSHHVVQEPTVQAPVLAVMNQPLAATAAQIPLINGPVQPDPVIQVANAAVPPLITLLFHQPAAPNIPRNYWDWYP